MTEKKHYDYMGQALIIEQCPNCREYYQRMYIDWVQMSCPSCQNKRDHNDTSSVKDEEAKGDT